MSQTHLQDYCPSFTPAATLAANILVTVETNGTVAAAAKGVRAAGTTARACDPADADLSKQRVTLLPLAGARCLTGISAGAIVAYAPAYQADNGKVDDVSTDAEFLGVFLTAASAANQEVTILQMRND